MCGIAGVVGDIAPDVARAALDAMLELQLHRGPDAGGASVVVHRGCTVALGNRRLAIVDLSQRGVQPFVDEVHGHVLVYNGELYNFRSLRDELDRLGHRFDSGTDTEVVLRAYQEWGEGALQRFVGMYGFAIWDPVAGRTLLVRDRLGIKPLYVGRGPGFTVFASEVRALLGSGLVDRSVSTTAVGSFLSFGAVQGPQTIIDGIRSLPPAHRGWVDTEGNLDVRRYWSLPFTERNTGARDARDAAVEVRTHLDDAVERQLVSDVPVGLFLSGGIDSSALAIAAAGLGRKLDTFSISFNEPGWGEGKYASQVAEQTGSEHREIVLTDADLLNILPRALASVDQPAYDGFNVFVVSEVARRAGVTVVLSGQGGDEIFGGYSSFLRVPAIARQRGIRTQIAKVGARAFGSWYPNDRLASSQRVAFAASAGDLFSAYVAQRTVFPERLRERLVGPAHRGAFDGIPLAEYERILAELEALDDTDQVSKLEIELYLANTLLRDGDVMSMANSIEVRVPLLDDVMVDHVVSQRGSIKMDREVPKPLLVGAVPELPREIWARPKQGFTLPWPLWLHTSLRAQVADVLSDPAAGTGIGLRRGAAASIWSDFSQSRRVVTWSMVWSLFVLLEWAARERVSG